MRAHTLPLLTLLVTTLTACQPSLDGDTAETTLTSASGASYTIYTFTPTAARDEAARPNTLYVLDGDGNFDEAAELVSARVARGDMPPTVVVGIGYGDEDTRRQEDYTPSTIDGVDGSGGAARFWDFVELVLIPHVEEAHHTATTRASRGIAGHSLGGLAVVHALLTRPLFGDHLALSPSLMWDEQLLFTTEQETRGSARRSRLFGCFGGRENTGSRTAYEAMMTRLEQRGTLHIQRAIERGQGHVGARAGCMRRGLDLLHLHTPALEGSP